MTVLGQSSRVSILADGSALASHSSRTISLVVVRRALGVPAVAEVAFIEPPESLTGELRVGAELVIRVGTVALFAGKVAAIEMEYRADAGRVLRFRAYDALEVLRQKQRIRRIENTSASGLASLLAGDVGLAAASDRPGADLPAAIQRGENDLEFLSRIAAADGLYPIIEGDALRLASLEGSGAAIDLRLGRELEELTVAISSERSVESAKAIGWDPLTHQSNTIDADRTAVQGAASQIIANRIARNAGQSRGRAAAAVQRGEAFERTAEGIALGNPEIMPTRVLNLSGADDVFGRRFVVTTALHRIDAGGYRTLFSTRPPILPMAERGPVVTLGKVVAVDDPDGGGRSKVTLPGFADTEALWLQTVVAGAGKKKGIGILPEPGDDVLVILPDGDLDHGFVLGGLYGTRTLPPGLRGRGDRPFVIRTGAGQTLELSGRGATVRLSTRNGSLIEFAGDRGRLAVAGDLTIEAPGKRIVIRADSIDFQRG